MNWQPLVNKGQLDLIDEESKSNPIVIFKHSTTCPISTTSLARLERKWKEEEASHIKAYYLDLLANRELSNYIASKYGIEHESPQVLLIKDGQVNYHESHFGIVYDDILNHSK